MAEDESRPVWDSEQALQLIGSTVLIGITRSGHDGEAHEQMFGVVVSADVKGVTIELSGSRIGTYHHLPPDLRGWYPAPPGEYRLRSTGEIVKDPDYISNWTVSSPQH